MSFEKYFDEIKTLKSPTSEVHYISIPKKLINGMGLNRGDTLKIMISKVDEKQQTEEEE